MAGIRGYVRFTKHTHTPPPPPRIPPSHIMYHISHILGDGPPYDGRSSPQAPRVRPAAVASRLSQRSHAPAGGAVRSRGGDSPAPLSLRGRRCRGIRAGLQGGAGQAEVGRRSSPEGRPNPWGGSFLLLSIFPFYFSPLCWPPSPLDFTIFLCLWVFKL